MCAVAAYGPGLKPGGLFSRRMARAASACARGAMRGARELGGCLRCGPAKRSPAPACRQAAPASGAYARADSLTACCPCAGICLRRPPLSLLAAGQRCVRQRCVRHHRWADHASFCQHMWVATPEGLPGSPGSRGPATLRTLSMTAGGLQASQASPSGSACAHSVIGPLIRLMRICESNHYNPCVRGSAIRCRQGWLSSLHAGLSVQPHMAPQQ